MYSNDIIIIIVCWSYLWLPWTRLLVMGHGVFCHQRSTWASLLYKVHWTINNQWIIQLSPQGHSHVVSLRMHHVFWRLCYRVLPWPTSSLLIVEVVSVCGHLCLMRLGYYVVSMFLLSWCFPLIEIPDRALVFLVFGSQPVQDSNPRPISIQQPLYYNIVGLCFMSWTHLLWITILWTLTVVSWHYPIWTNPTNMKDVPFTKWSGNAVWPSVCIMITS